MTEPTRPPTAPGGRRRAEPKRSARPARRTRTSTAGGPAAAYAWLRSTPGLVVFAVVMIGLAFLVRVLVTDDGEASAAQKAPGAVNGTYGTSWTTEDGSSYEISLETLSDLGTGQSGSGCLTTPPAGTANLSFRVVVTNKSPKEADVPLVYFGTDLAPGGEVDPARQVLSKANKRLEITPLAAGTRDCKEVARIGPERGTIPAGGFVEFRATFGPIKVPATTVPTIVYRYYGADGAAADLLAPFSRF